MASYSSDYELFLGATQSFCHICGNLDKLVDTHILKKENDVYLRKFCAKCGDSYVKISSDYNYYQLCNEYLKKPDLPQRYLTKVDRGCPYDCGVCPQHQNHPCLALFNITHECNLKCNICYFDSMPNLGKHKSLEEIKKMLDTLLSVESEPDLIQVTGGEPTEHPKLLEILKLLKNSPVRHLMLNTNGVKIANDKEFVKELKRLGRGFEVYLQFDSLNRDTLLDIRAADLREVREKALANLEEADISTTLVCVVKKHLNDKEIPKIIEYARGFRCVRGVVFQPVQEAGRVLANDDFRITLSEIRKIIINDSNNPFKEEDLIPLPCDPHKICVAYGAKEFKDGFSTILPVTGKIPKEVITKQKGTVSFEQDRDFVKGVIELVSLDTAFGEAIIKDKIKNRLFCCWPSFLSPKDMGYENVFRVVIMEFSDIYNFDATNIKRECNFMIEKGRVIPFSTYNMGLYEKD